jgi:hypothetical protein
MEVSRDRSACACLSHHQVGAVGCPPESLWKAFRRAEIADQIRLVRLAVIIRVLVRRVMGDGRSWGHQVATYVRFNLDMASPAKVPRGVWRMNALF